MDHFDYESEAREAGITDEQLRPVCQIVRSEFPSDVMMYEPHVLRACMAIREGHLTIEQALAPNELTAKTTPRTPARTPS